MDSVLILTYIASLFVCVIQAGQVFVWVDRCLKEQEMLDFLEDNPFMPGGMMFLPGLCGFALFPVINTIIAVFLIHYYITNRGTVNARIAAASRRRRDEAFPPLQYRR